MKRLSEDWPEVFNFPNTLNKPQSVVQDVLDHIAKFRINSSGRKARAKVVDKKSDVRSPDEIFEQICSVCANRTGYTFSEISYEGGNMESLLSVWQSAVVPLKQQSVARQGGAIPLSAIMLCNGGCGEDSAR